VRYLPIQIFPHEVAGIPTGYRVEYQASCHVELQLEVSLLNHRFLKGLSVLPAPTVTVIEPSGVQLGIVAEGHAVPKTRPTRAEIREAVQRAIDEQGGYYINGNRVGQ